MDDIVVLIADSSGMEPEINVGDEVVIDQSTIPGVGDLAAVTLHEGGATFGRAIYDDLGQPAVSLNNGAEVQPAGLIGLVVAIHPGPDEGEWEDTGPSDFRAV